MKAESKGGPRVGRKLYCFDFWGGQDFEKHKVLGEKLVESLRGTTEGSKSREHSTEWMEIKMGWCSLWRKGNTSFNNTVKEE